MDEIEKIRKRVNPEEKKAKSHLFTLFMTVFGLIAIALGFLIYAKQNPTGKVFGLEMAAVNDRIGKTFSNLFNFNIFGDGDDADTVAAIVKYQPVGNDLYVYDDQSIPALKDGTVSYITKQNNEYFAVISYDNGITASYFGIDDLLIKQYDRLKAGDNIGSYSENFKVLFVKNDKPITYEDACQ